MYFIVMVLVEKFVTQSANAASLLLCLNQRNEPCDRANEIRGEGERELMAK